MDSTGGDAKIVPAMEENIPSPPDAPNRSRVSTATRSVALTTTGFVAGVLAGVFICLTAMGLGPNPFSIFSEMISTKYQPEYLKKLNNNKTATPITSFELNFPTLYPELGSTKKSLCRAAWNALTSVPCHEKILDRSLDYGTFTSVNRWDPMHFLPNMCRAECHDALRKAYNELSDKCSSLDDDFFIDGYEGHICTAQLEKNPAAAVDTLLNRLDHACRVSPDGDSDFEYCPIEMYERFQVFDSTKANLEGVNTFLRATTWLRDEPSQRKKGTSVGPNYKYTYDYSVRRQTYGPGLNQTSCDWCVFDYLNFTLNSWTEGGIFLPDTRAPVSLVEFIARINNAGRRCGPTNRWEDIYKEAISRYHAAGLLPPEWVDRSLPLGLNHIMLNGPSTNTYPVSDIVADYEHLNSIIDYFPAQSQYISNQLNCLSQLSEKYTSASCHIAITPEYRHQLLLNDVTYEMLENYCSSKCTFTLDAWSSGSCDHGKINGRLKRYYDDYWQSVNARANFCNFLIPDPRTCAQALVNIDKTEWLLTGVGYKWQLQILTELDSELEKLKAKVAPLQLSYPPQAGQHPLGQSSSGTFEKETRRKQMDMVKTSICAKCISQFFLSIHSLDSMHSLVSMNLQSEHVEYATAWPGFMKKYYTTCMSLGADWMGGAPYGDDPRIWRVKNEQGRVLRYVQLDGTLAIYRADEDTGKADLLEGGTAPRPLWDMGSLWHVLEIERAIEATKEGRFYEWQAEEKEFRRKEDEKIWEINRDPRTLAYKVSYIGPGSANAR